MPTLLSRRMLDGVGMPLEWLRLSNTLLSSLQGKPHGLCPSTLKERVENVSRSNGPMNHDQEQSVMQNV